MSKRGNDNQLTKDEYDRDKEDDSSEVMGTFKQASSDEMSRRAIKAPRGRKLGGATTEGLKPSPFTGFSGFSAPAPSGGITFGTTAASSSAVSQPAAPVFSFGVTPTSSTAVKPPTSTSGGFSFGANTTISSATSATTPPSFTFGATPKSSETSLSSSIAATSAPMFSFGGSTASFGGFGKPSTTTTSPFPTQSNAKESVTKPAPSSPIISFAPKESASKPTTSAPLFSSFAKETASKPATIAPSFSFGSSSTSSSTSSNPFSIQKAIKKDETSLIDDLNRDLNNDLTELNNKFSDKISKELKKNSHMNLAILFSQYTSHRRQVKNHYLDLIESASINDSEGEKVDHVKAQSSGSAPKLSFGLPLSDIKENEPAKSNFSGFNFGIDKPATSSTSAGIPAFGGFGKTGSTPFSFGAPAASSAAEPPKPATSGAFGFTLPTASKETSLFSIPAASSAATTSASSPFAFAAKPFSFNPPASTSSTPAVTPAPFAGFSVPTPQSIGSSQGGGDNEKMPDDTKSELVDSREGEEGEETVLEVKAKLFAFQNGEHKDLGVGQFRINENTETQKRRMIMRTTGTGHLTLNSWVIQGMGPKREKNTVTIFGIEDGKPKRFVLRVKEEQSAMEVVKELEHAQTAK